MFLDSSLDIINNSNTGHSFLDMHGMHLDEHSAGKLPLNFAKRIRFIVPGLVNKKLARFTQQSVALEGQTTI